MTEPSPALQISMPADVPVAYADFANVWHTSDVFVIDFIAVESPSVPAQDEQGNQVMVVPSKVVQRIRIPPTQVFELMKALETQLSRWELERGTQPGIAPTSA